MTSKEQKDKKTDPSQANREEETNLSKDKDVQNHNEEVDEVEVDSSNNEAESSISAEEQEELLKKYDAESNTRDVKGIVAGIVFVLMLAFSLFQIYTGIFGEYTAYIQRTVHLGFACHLYSSCFQSIRKSVNRVCRGTISYSFCYRELFVGIGHFLMMCSSSQLVHYPVYTYYSVAIVFY